MGLDELDFKMRSATEQDEAFLGRMLWMAVHWRDLPDRQGSVPHEVFRYTEGFGRRGDHGVIATHENCDVGAAWCRLLVAPNRGYGYIADDVPELSLAVMPQFRDQGIGTALLDHLLSEAALHFDSISLSVESDNAALSLYERHGFAMVEVNEGSWTMDKVLTQGTE